MNTPYCIYHKDRKSEMLCLNLGCENRLTLMCTICLHQSRCKRHNWKIIQTFIEQILQSAQNEQVKSQKSVNSIDKFLMQQLSQMSNQLRSQLNLIIAETVNRFNEMSKSLLQKVISQKNHNLIKNIIKQFKKSEKRDIKTLSNILKKVDPFITADQQGVIYINQKNKIANNDQIQGQFTLLAQQKTIIIQKFKQNRDHKKISEQKQLINLELKKYQQQIRQIPILKSRIQSLNEKLKAKEYKLKIFEEKAKQQQYSVNKSSLQINELKNKLQNQRTEKSKRVQNILSLKNTLTKNIQNHTNNCLNDCVKIHKLTRNQKNANTANPYCQYGALLNFSMMNLVDQLLFLGSKQSEHGQFYIQVPIIQKRKKSSYLDAFFSPFKS